MNKPKTITIEVLDTGFMVKTNGHKYPYYEETRGIDKEKELMDWIKHIIHK